MLRVAAHHPDYLAYVNGFAGKNPQNVLVDSNYEMKVQKGTLSHDALNFAHKLPSHGS
jgi:hypothetical protein